MLRLLVAELWNINESLVILNIHLLKCNFEAKISTYNVCSILIPFPSLMVDWSGKTVSVLRELREPDHFQSVFTSSCEYLSVVWSTLWFIEYWDYEFLLPMVSWLFMSKKTHSLFLFKALIPPLLNRQPAFSVVWTEGQTTIVWYSSLSHQLTKCSLSSIWKWWDPLNFYKPNKF